jgi:hypothetical protein
MIGALITVFAIIGLIIYPNYSVSYGGEILEQYKIGLICGIFLISVILVGIRYYLNSAIITSKFNVLYDLINLIYGLLILYIVGTFVVCLYRINNFTGEVFKYGKLCVMRVYDIAEKQEWLANLQNTIKTIPEEILAKAKMNLANISSQKDLLDFVTMNIKSVNSSLIADNTGIAITLENNTSVFSHVVGHIASHPYLYGFGILTIVVLYNWSKIWSFFTQGDGDFGTVLKDTVSRIGDGFDAANKQVDVISAVHQEVVEVTNLLNKFASKTTENLTMVNTDVTTLTQMLSNMIQHVERLEQTVVSNQLIIKSLLAAQECASQLHALPIS